VQFERVYVYCGACVWYVDMDSYNNTHKLTSHTHSYTHTHTHSGVEFNSTRSVSVVFGPDVVRRFCKRTGIDLIIRAHQVRV
jgi:hypothetical protein